jgi:uncharacterized repeat protein (TIGR01451 family)
MHSNIHFPSPQAVTDTINLFSSLGVDNQITELDISVYTNSGDAIKDYASIPTDWLIQQGYLYRDFFQAFRQLQGQISSVTFWGQADDHTWLTTSQRVDAPLLFDQGLQHKFAYLGLVDPLKLPGADIATTMTARPRIVRHGHRVSYTITVTNNGPDAAAILSLVDDLPPDTLFHSLTVPPGWACTTPPRGGTGQTTCTTDSLDAGASVQCPLTLTVDPATPDGTTIANSVTVTSTSRNPNPAPSNSAAAEVLVRRHREE